MAETTVSIGADLTAIRRELGKLPNLSAEAAQKTLIQVEKAVQKAEAAAKKSAKAIKKAQKAAAKESRKAIEASARASEKALKGIGDTAGDTDSSLKAVAGAIGLISPEAEKALSSAGDLAGGLEGVTRGTGILGGSMAALGALVAAAAVAFAALATVYLAVRNASEQAAEEGGRLAARVEETRARSEAAAAKVRELTAAWQAYNDGAQAWRDKIDLINGAITETELATRNATKALTDQARASLVASGTLVASIEAQIEANEALIKSGKLSFKEELALTKQQDKLKVKIKGATEALDKRKKTLDDDIKAVTDAIQYNEELGKSNKFVADQERARTKAAVDGAKQRAAALKREQEGWDNFLSELDQIIEALAEVKRARRGLSDEIEDSPPDVVPPQWIKDLRKLQETTDQLVGANVLSEVDQLGQHLASLQGAWKASGFSDEMIADQIKRVEARMAELASEAADALTAVEGDPDPDVSFFEKIQAAAGKTVSAISGIGGAIGGAVGMFDRFLQMAGGFSLADLGAIAAEGGDVSGAVEEMIQGGRDTIKVFVESLPAVIDAFVAELPGLMEDFTKAIRPVVASVADAVPVVIDQIVAALPGLVSTVADLITSGLFDQIISKLPSVVSAILDELPTVITALLAAVGDVVAAFISQIPAIVLTVIDALPLVLKAVTDALPDLAVQIVQAIIYELIPRLPEISIAMTKALLMDLPEALAESFTESVQKFFEDLMAELGPGDPKTETFGDTPGPVRAPLSGLRARFAPGDTVIAAQDPQELLRQARQAAGDTGSGARAVTLDLRDGHLAFDRMFRTNIRSGGSLSTLINAPVGRVKVYG